MLRQLPIRRSQLTKTTIDIARDIVYDINTGRDREDDTWDGIRWACRFS